MEDFLDFEKGQVFKLEIEEDNDQSSEVIYAKFHSAKYVTPNEPCHIIVQQILEMDKFFDLRDDYKVVKRKIDCDTIKHVDYEVREAINH